MFSLDLSRLRTVKGLPYSVATQCFIQGPYDYKGAGGEKFMTMLLNEMARLLWRARAANVDVRRPGDPIT